MSIYKSGEKLLKGKKYYTTEEVNHMNTGAFTLSCSDDLRYLVGKALSKVPIKYVNRIMTKCVILSTDAGEYMPADVVKKFIKGKSLIIISSKYKDPEYAILHECAHFCLKHTHGYISKDWTEEVRLKQETEADDLVKNWLSDYEKADSMAKKSDDELVKLYWESRGLDFNSIV